MAYDDEYAAERHKSKKGSISTDPKATFYPLTEERLQSAIKFIRAGWSPTKVVRLLEINGIVLNNVLRDLYPVVYKQGRRNEWRNAYVQKHGSIYGK